MTSEVELLNNMGPYNDAMEITAADSDLSHPVQKLYVGSAGDVRVTTVNDDDVNFKSVPAGTILPVWVKRVWSTNTTGSDFVGLY